MRALWQKFGKPGGKLTGYVDNPYTIDDVRRTLGDVAGNQAFADDFFRRYIQGHDLPDYETLLARAGLLWRAAAAGRPSVGSLASRTDRRSAIVAATPFGSPAYTAGLDRDDVIVALGDTPVRDAAGFVRALEGRKPGERVAVTFDRRGQRSTATIAIVEDPRRELVPVEATGASLTDAQRRFREAWLSSAARNTF